MDRIKDFFEEFKNRLNSPLFGSFIFSWLAFNWPVVIGLLFYKQADLLKDGYTSYFDLIHKSYDPWITLIYPFAVAVAYTLLAPKITAWIKEYQAGIATKSEDKILDITKTGFISVSKYMKLREGYKAQVDALIKLYQEEDLFSNELAILRAEKQDFLKTIRENEQVISGHVRDLRRYEEVNKTSFLDGEWNVTGLSHNERWNFSNGRITVYNSSIGQNHYDITDYFNNTQRCEIAFTTETTISMNHKQRSTYILRYDMHLLQLKGKFNDAEDVRFMKIIQHPPLD